MRHQRRFDDTRTRAMLGKRDGETDVNLEYLLSGLDLAGQGGTRAGPPPARASLPPARPVAPGSAGAWPVPAPPPPRSLTFVVTAGRSGSTALSAILRSHPDVLS